VFSQLEAMESNAKEEKERKALENMPNSTRKETQAVYYSLSLLSKFREATTAQQ